MTDEKDLTYGAKLVGVNFNPSDNANVHRIKARAAQLINAINIIDSGANDQMRRWKQDAIHDVEAACMFGVKAAVQAPPDPFPWDKEEEQSPPAAGANASDPLDRGTNPLAQLKLRENANGDMVQTNKVTSYKSAAETEERILTTNYLDLDNPAGGVVNGKGIDIKWQNGPINREAGEKPNGAFVEDVMKACIIRLMFYQDSKFACKENERALNSLCHAYLDLIGRREDRKKRGVHGKHEK